MPPFHWNFRTHEFEFKEVEDFSDYLPQDASTQALYQMYLAMGDKPADAALKVLEHDLGVTHTKTND